MATLERPPARGRLPDALLAVRPYLGIAVLLIVWQLVTAWADNFFFPPPTTILAAAWSMWLSGPVETLFLTDAVFDNVLPSLARLIAGWTLSVVLGVAIGLAIGGIRWLADALQPTLEFLRALPSPALIPVFLILLGTGSTMRVTVIVLGSIWPVLLNSIEAMRTLDRGQADVSKVFRLPLHARIARIILPAAMPRIFAGMRVSLAIAIILMVVSELIAASSGIGFAIVNAQIMFQMPEMWANVLLLAVLGVVLNALFSMVENRVLYWHFASRDVER